MKYESVQQAREALKKLEQTQAAYNHALGVLYLDATTAAPSSRRDALITRKRTMSIPPSHKPIRARGRICAAGRPAQELCERENLPAEVLRRDGA